MTVNTELLDQVVEEALSSASGKVRWINAIRRGAELIKSNRCTPQDDETLLILSTSGHDYIVSLAECKDTTGELCPAFKLNRPCKQRAAFHLLVRCKERAERAEL